MQLTLWLAVAALLPLTALVGARRVPPALDRLPHPGLLTVSPRGEWLLDLAAQGVPLLMPVAVIGVAMACWLVGVARAAVFSLLAPACAYATTVTLKALLERPSEDGSGWMFPSGHVTVVVAVATVLAVLLPRDGVLGARLPHRLLPLAQWVTVLAAASTSVATAVQRHHYPTDVVGGVLTALITVLLVALLIDRIPRSVS